MSQLFRKGALDKLQSPERLNDMVQITTKKGWFALAGISGIIVIGVIWCFLGRIPEVVSGDGMLLQHDGITEVISNGTGILSKMYAQEGDTALLMAAFYGHADCVRLLLDAGADKEAHTGVRRVGPPRMWIYWEGRVVFSKQFVIQFQQRVAAL